uniref:BTB domain-containing protein n=1 Tax=Parascaris univalens TaxID=6257 RepID=A0A915AVJ9_PARUN
WSSPIKVRNELRIFSIDLSVMFRFSNDRYPLWRKNGTSAEENCVKRSKQSPTGFTVYSRDEHIITSNADCDAMQISEEPTGQSSNEAKLTDK